MKKLLIFTVAVIMIMAMAIGLVACGKKKPNEDSGEPPASVITTPEQGGEQGGNTGTEQGGEQGGNTGSEQGGEQGGNTGSEQGGEQQPENNVFAGKTVAQIETALGENFILRIEKQDDYYTGTSTVTKDKGYVLFHYVSESVYDGDISTGYDNNILIKDDYYLSRENSEERYFYANGYGADVHKSTDVNDIQSAYNTLINSCANIKYTAKEQTTLLNRECTKLVYETSPNAIGQVVKKEYIIDNTTGLCLKYSYSMSSPDDEPEIEVVEVKSFTTGMANLDSEIAKIICAKWLTNEQFTELGLTKSVTAPNGVFENNIISFTDTNANAVYDIDYILNGMDKAEALCQAFYDAGAKLNSDESQVDVGQLYVERTAERIEFQCYTTKGYVTIECEKNEYFKNYDLTVYIAVTGDNHTHRWSTVNYEWSSDNKTCTATRICEKNNAHLETQTVNTSALIWQQQTCEKPELTNYTAMFTNSAFGVQTRKNVETKPALGHKFDQEKVNNKFLKAQATCTEKAVYYKSCSCGTKGTETFEYGNALGHDYQLDSFEWREITGGYSAVAKFVCSNDSEHMKEETATVTSEITTPATCSATGEIVYTATVTVGEQSYDDTKTVEIPINQNAHNLVEDDAVAPTCTESGKQAGKHCDNCDYTEGGQEVNALGHDFSGEYASYDETHHYTTCKRCNEENIVECEFSNKWSYNEAEHYHKCSVCENVSANAEHRYDENDTCICGQKDPDACDHSYTINDYDETYHFKRCENCSEIDESSKVAHNYDQEKVEEKYLKESATCTNKAVYYKSCSCGYYVEDDENTFEYGNKLEHYLVEDDAVAPTCTESGKQAGKHCDNCDYTEGGQEVNALGHDFSGEYASCDDTHHSTTCKRCSEENIVECEFSNKWSYNEAEHYHKCSVCENVSANAEHSYDENDTCICGKKDSNACEHSYIVDDYDETHHFKRCENCSEIDESSKVAHNYDQEKVEEKYLKESATCTNKAVYYKSCSCGAKGTETFVNGNALGHNYEFVEFVWTKTANNYTAVAKYVCLNDSKHEKLETANVESQITTQATCKKEGERLYTATYDDKTDTAKEIIALNANNHEEETFNYEDNGNGKHTAYYDCCNAVYKTGNHIPQLDDDDCTTEVKCTLCDAVTTTAKKNHNFGEWKYEDEQNHVHSCKNGSCTQTEREEHTYDIEDYTYFVSARTCTEGEKYYLLCVCGRHGEETFEKYPALGHDYGAWEETPATCTEDGSRTRICQREDCGDTETETINAIGHNFDKSVCIEIDENYHGHKCTRCDEIDETTKQAHAFNQEVVDENYFASEANCTESAKYYKSCLCGKGGESTFNYGEPKSHDYTDVEWGVLIDPTCEVNGTKYKDCINCGEDGRITDSIPATGHNYDYTEETEWVWTETIDGYTAVVKFSCVNDYEHKDEVTANVVIKSQTASTCSSYGEIVYKGTVTKGAKTYTDEKTVELELDSEKHTPNTDNWYYDDLTNHYRKCYDCGEKINESVTAHTWNSGEITTEPTCTEKGEKTYICTACGAEKYEEVAMSPHNFDNEYWDYDVDNHWKTCSDCGENDVNSEAHQYGEDDYCVCGQLNPDHCDHNYVKGYNESKHYDVCEYCKNVINLENHNFQSVVDEQYLVREATCLLSAKYYKSCSCGAKSETTFNYGSSLGHDFDAEHCDDDYHICKRCDESFDHVFLSNSSFCRDCNYERYYSLGLKYSEIMSNEEYEVSWSNKCTDKDIVIRDTYQGFPVTAISSHGFDNKDITSVKLPNNLKKINMYAFYNTSLANIVIPNNVELIGMNAFYNKDVNQLKSVVLPASIERIENYAFSYNAEICKFFYMGTEAQLENIVTSLNFKTDGSVYFYSETAPTSAGQYWFYKNGEPTVWTVTEPDGHVWGEWEHDYEYHWRNCTTPDCVGEEKDTHTFDGDKCICGIYNPETCTHSFEQLTNEEMHYNQCSLCLTIQEECYHYYEEIVQEEYLKTPATCIEPAVYYKSCECGFKSEETFENGEPLGHSFEDCAIITAPTCTSEGERKIICSVCEFESTETMAIIPHSYTGYDYKEDEHWSTCICGEIEADSNVEHIWNNWQETTAPTCTETGIMTYTCVCGKTKTEEIEKRSHSYEETIISESTWTVHGEKEYRCSVCDHNYREALYLLSADPNLTYQLVDDDTHYVVSGISLSQKDMTVYIPNYYNGKPVVGIADNAFKNKGNIKAVNIQGYDNNDTIGVSAFEGCQYLESVVSGTGKKLSNSSFKNCFRLSTLDFAVSQLGEYTFSGCTNLVQVNRSASVTVIPDYAFSGCKYLVNVNNGDITKIGKNAFAGCENLSTIYLSSDVKIDESAFLNANVSETRYRASLNQWVSANRIANEYAMPQNLHVNSLTLVTGDIDLSTGSSIIYKYVLANLPITSVVLSSSLTKIQEGAFLGTNITSITIPEGVKKIEAKTFKNCRQLTSVNLGSVEIIGKEAFSGCSSLTNIDFGSSVKTVFDSAFASSGLTGVVYIPSNIRYVGAWCFGYCNNLTGVEFETTSGWRTAAYLEVDCEAVNITDNGNDNLDMLYNAIFQGDFLVPENNTDLYDVIPLEFGVKSDKFFNLDTGNIYFKISPPAGTNTNGQQIKISKTSYVGNQVNTREFYIKVYAVYGNVLLDLSQYFVFDGTGYVAGTDRQSNIRDYIEISNRGDLYIFTISGEWEFLQVDYVGST